MGDLIPIIAFILAFYIITLIIDMYRDMIDKRKNTENDDWEDEEDEWG